MTCTVQGNLPDDHMCDVFASSNDLIFKHSAFVEYIQSLIRSPHHTHFKRSSHFKMALFEEARKELQVHLEEYQENDVIIDEA